MAMKEFGQIFTDKLKNVPQNVENWKLKRQTESGTKALREQEDLTDEHLIDKITEDRDFAKGKGIKWDFQLVVSNGYTLLNPKRIPVRL